MPYRVTNFQDTPNPNAVKCLLDRPIRDPGRGPGSYRTAQAAASATNLRGFASGMKINAADSKAGNLTTGAFDWAADGDVRKVGWVFDMLRLKVANPGAALDPANPSFISETVLYYYGITPVLNDGEGSLWNPTGTSTTTLNQAARVTTAGTASKNLSDNGFNTNYAASWYLVRGDQVATNTTTSVGGQAGTYTHATKKVPLSGTGALTENNLANAVTSSDKIPCMSESRIADTTDSEIDSTDAGTFNQLANGTTVGTDIRTIARAGDLSVESFTDGVSATDTTSAGNPLDTHELNDFWPLHGASRQVITVGSTSISALAAGFANVMMADGHVEKFYDTTGISDIPDGWVGPFPGAINASSNFTTFTYDAEVAKELNGRMWLKKILPINAAGGGSEN